MTLILEDGSNVAGANTYCTLVEIRAYASMRGVTLSSDDSVLTPLSFQAMDYIESKRKDFQGWKSNYIGDDGTLPIPQPLQWPRRNVFIDNSEVAFNAIPVELKNAQCQLCIELANGVDLMPTSTGQFVKMEKVGTIETQYSETIGTTGIPTLPKVDVLMEPLLNDGGDFTITTVRI